MQLKKNSKTLMDNRCFFSCRNPPSAFSEEPHDQIFYPVEKVWTQNDYPHRASFASWYALSGATTRRVTFNPILIHLPEMKGMDFSFSFYNHGYSI